MKKDKYAEIFKKNGSVFGYEEIWRKLIKENGKNEYADLTSATASSIKQSRKNKKENTCN